jgi:hypothetical protein
LFLFQPLFWLPLSLGLSPSFLEWNSFRPAGEPVFVPAF